MSNMVISCDGFDFSLFNPTQFRLSFSKLPRVPFFCQSVNIPEVSIGTATAASRWHDVNLPGEKLNFGQFSAQVLLDSNMTTYSEIYTWMRNISVLGGATDDTSYCEVHAGGTAFHFNNVYPVEIGNLGLSKTLVDSPGLSFPVVFNFTTFDLKRL